MLPNMVHPPPQPKTSPSVMAMRLVCLSGLELVMLGTVTVVSGQSDQCLGPESPGGLLGGGGLWVPHLDPNTMRTQCCCGWWLCTGVGQ